MDCAPIGAQPTRRTTHVEVRFGQAERDAVEEADGLASAVPSLPGQSPLVVKEDEVLLNFLRGNLLGAAAIVKREPGNGLEVGLLGALAEAANRHVIGHALAKPRHGSSPFGSDLSRRHAHALAVGLTVEHL